MNNKNKTMKKDNEIADNPRLHYGENYETDDYIKKRFQIYISFLKPYLKPGVKILDVGGYTADMLDYLPSYVDYHLVDFDEEALKIARNKGAKTKRIAFDRGDIEFDNKKFDIIIAAEVLEHLQDPARHIRRIRELLNDDGIVVISFPNENMIYHRIMSLLGYGIDMCAFELYKHLHLPTIAQSEKFVGTYFKILEKDYYINPSAKGSRSEWLGSILTIFPDTFWVFLARNCPGLFARGVIFLAKKY